MSNVFSFQQSLIGLIDSHAASQPEAPAVNHLSYRALASASRAVAARLLERGLKPGDRVVVYSENSVDVVLAYLGIFRAGSIAVPVNALYSTPELERVLKDADAKICLASAARRASLPGTSARLVLDIGQVAHSGAERSAAGGRPLELRPGEPALLSYTSGSTGHPRGAMMSRGNLVQISRQITRAFEWTPRDRLLLALPLFHAAGLYGSLFPALWAGGHVQLLERFNADAVLEALSRGAATMFFGVPTMFVRILDAARPGRRLNGIRLMVSGSSSLSPELHQRFLSTFGISIVERYGGTEMGSVLANSRPEPREPGEVGFPLEGVHARLVTPTGEEPPPGAPGELAIAGPSVFLGYWRNERSTAEAFVTDSAGTRWFRTGDVATYDVERGFKLIGRLKDVIINGGFKVYAAEVERCLEEVPGVVAAAVVGAPDAGRGEVPVAFVEVTTGFSEQVALSALRESLASFKVPRAVHVVQSLPRTATQKIEKWRLREQAAALS